MNNVHLFFPDQTPNQHDRGWAPASCINAMHNNSGFRCAVGQKRVTQRDQLRSVSARYEAPQKEKRLVLSSTVIPAKVDNQRTHAQASPGFGHERCVSFSPARSRPSLRYLM
jgi:hypothetical protein